MTVGTSVVYPLLMADTENDEIFYCSAQTYAQTLETPAEYCENEVDEDGDYCHLHGGWDDDGPDPDDARDAWLEQQWEDRYERDHYDD